MPTSIRSASPESPILWTHNSSEPPWYGTRMPGGVTGNAREGLPMSINGRLGHTYEGRGEGSEWLEAGLRGLATSGPGRGSSPGHQRAIAAQIRDEDSHRVDDSAHGSRRLRDGKTAVNHMWASTTSGCTPRPWSYMPTRIGVRSGHSEASRPPGRSPSDGAMLGVLHAVEKLHHLGGAEHHR